MASSVSAVYHASKGATAYTYVVLLTNTSTVGFDIYQLLLGVNLNLVGPNIGVTATNNLQNLFPISAPTGWTWTGGTGSLEAAALYVGSGGQRGTPAAAGYIMPGGAGAFVFQSTTPPPKAFYFACSFFVDQAGEVGDVGVYQGSMAESPGTPTIQTGGVGGISRTIGGDNDGPSVTVVYNGLGGIVAVIHNPPPYAIKRGP